MSRRWWMVAAALTATAAVRVLERWLTDPKHRTAHDAFDDHFDWRP